MPLYRMDGGTLVEQPRTTFSAKGVREVQHLQAALRECIDALTPEKGDLLVLSTEYRNWADSQRRIDLLAVDRSGCLVVIELKRTEDAGHAELQALRYAAMVSQMTFDEGVQALALHRKRVGDDAGAAHAAEDLHSFLAEAPTDDDDETDPRTRFARRVRIVLAAADFSREVTGTVLWLRDNSAIDIRCVRLTPYDVDGRLHVYTEQIIPLPEAEDYRVRKAQREHVERAATATQRAVSRGAYTVLRDERRLTEGPVSRRRAFALVLRKLLELGETPESLASHLRNPKLWHRADGDAPSEAVREEIRALYPNDRQRVARYDLAPEDLIRHGGATYALLNQGSATQLPALTDLAARYGIRWSALAPAEVLPSVLED